MFNYFDVYCNFGNEGGELMDVREVMKRPIKVDKDRKLSDAIKLMEK